MDDNTPVYDMLFEMQISISDRFPALTPILQRQSKAREIFILLTRYNRYSAKQKKNNGKKNIIRRPAGDDWF